MMAHVLLAFLFLHLPQNDTIPKGVACHTGLLQIPVYRNCSFYWHHSGFDNYNMGRLVNEINITRGCGIKDNFFCCRHFSSQSVRQQPERTTFLQEQLCVK